MKRTTLICALLAATGLSCSTGIGFGPFSSSSLGNLSAGVGGFIPGTVPEEGQFLLTVANTDSTTAYTVVVTPSDDVPITRSVTSCSTGAFAVSCTATTILIEVQVSGSATLPSLSIVPDATTCPARIVYIEIPIDTTTGEPTADATPELTETLPASAATCTVSASE